MPITQEEQQASVATKDAAAGAGAGAAEASSKSKTSVGGRMPVTAASSAAEVRPFLVSLWSPPAPIPSHSTVPSLERDTFARWHDWGKQESSALPSLKNAVNLSTSCCDSLRIPPYNLYGVVVDSQQRE